MRNAFSLVECTVSVMLVGILMAGALRGLSTSHLRDADSLLRMHGKQLCESFHQEIVSKAFVDPTDASTQLGVNGTERQTLRSTLDDVDDYAAMNLTPPTDTRGNAIAGSPLWRIAVNVHWVDPLTLATASTHTKLKRIFIQVYHDNRLITSLTSYRAADEY